jgi:Protein of unknown function (DUF3761)/Protein of unknown function (DUF2510)
MAQPGWYPDPRARAEWRYFDGTSWTVYVSRGGVAGTDPIAPVPSTNPSSNPPTNPSSNPSSWPPPVSRGPVPVSGPGPVPARSPSPRHAPLSSGARFLTTRTGKLTSTVFGAGLLLAALVNATGRTAPTVPAKPDVLDLQVTAPATTVLPASTSTSTITPAVITTMPATTTTSAPEPPATTGTATEATPIPTPPSEVAAPVGTTAAPTEAVAPVTAPAPFVDPAAAGAGSDLGGTGPSCGEGAYRNSKGVCVPSPVAAPAPPAGATARCNDGTWSFSKTHSGSCSHHGGVDYFL